ncbi:LLM class flavin-dependent oxidoreductase [Actinoplanes sp. NPDC026619]|uniref:LLM class flavin-dependent oxidoreductase n=1 Tax=Actinoplanes sp. NPDC026619 TaxID=3155798 RepID=UPI0033FE65D0
MALKFGVVLPGGTAREQLEQAVLAEEAGWDGVFVWEAAYGLDAWSLLSAMAVGTSRVRLGTMLTPLPWRRPWKVASQVATLDQLSGGRAVLGIGVGAVDAGLPVTGEPTDLRERAARMDEGIDLIRALWAGEPTFAGDFYSYRAGGNDLRPVQERVPIWVVGVWPRLKSMRRVLRCDGVIPGHEQSPGATREMREWLTAQGSSADILAEGETSAAEGASQVAPWAEAGCTWWMETRWQAETKHEIRDRIAAGPPRS